MTLLTDKQLEELVKAGAAAIAAYHGGEENEDDEAHVQLALTAALPVIERAVLERAAKLHDDQACVLNSKRPLTNGESARMGWHWRQAKAIRALAGEVG